MAEGIRREMPDVCTHGIKHPAGESDDIARHCQRVFYELVAGVGNIPPEKIFNFDQTNFTDDPGMNKCVVLHDARRIEMIHEHSKTAISVMWYGSARVAMIPPWSYTRRSTSMKVGRRAAYYDCMPSGWFDGRTFTRWLLLAFLPGVRQLEGRKEGAVGRQPGVAFHAGGD